MMGTSAIQGKASRRPLLSRVKLDVDGRNQFRSLMGYLASSLYRGRMALCSDTTSGERLSASWTRLGPFFFFRASAASFCSVCALEKSRSSTSTSQIGRAHSELQSLMRISYAVFCLKKKKNINEYTIIT